MLCAARSFVSSLCFCRPVASRASLTSKPGHGAEATVSDDVRSAHQRGAPRIAGPAGCMHGPIRPARPVGSVKRTETKAHGMCMSCGANAHIVAAHRHPPPSLAAAKLTWWFGQASQGPSSEAGRRRSAAGRGAARSASLLPDFASTSQLSGLEPQDQEEMRRRAPVIHVLLISPQPRDRWCRPRGAKAWGRPSSRTASVGERRW
jgi:hypothetical protein